MDVSALVGCWFLVCIRMIFFYKFLNVRPFDNMAFFGYWEGWVHVNRFNDTSWVAVITPTDRPKSDPKRCVIDVLEASLCCQFIVEFSVSIRVLS